MSDYEWLKFDNKKNQEWTDAQNKITNNWFYKEDLLNRINFLKNKNKKSIYREIIECNEVVYACKQHTDSSLSIVQLDMDFNEIKTIISNDVNKYGFVPFTIIPNPIYKSIVALQVLKINKTDPSLIIWDIDNSRAIKTIDDTFYFDWSCDGNILYYSNAFTDVQHGKKINYFKSIYLNSLDEELLFTDNDNDAIWIQPIVSKSGNVFIHIFKDYRTVIVKMFNPDTKTIIDLFENGSNNNYLGMYNGLYYFYTSSGYENGKIVILNEDNTVKDFYKSDTLITGVALISDKLYIITITDGSNNLITVNLQTGFKSKMYLPNQYYAIDTLTGLKRDNGLYSNYLYLTYQSFEFPQSIIKIDPLDDSIQFVSLTSEVVPENMWVEKVYIQTRDKKKTVAFLVYKPDKFVKGKMPTLMYGYGGYGDCTVPWYNALYLDLDIVDWVNRGGLYVHCVIRGGGEFGEEWHREGMLNKKKNSFYDFIDIAEWLIKNNYTTSQLLSINGGSNGGLLTAAVITMRPELFKAAVINLPLTDMINYCNDERGPMYINEFGDPRKELHEYILSYSPLHNIKKTNYPALFIQTGKLDKNVPCYHAKQFYAKIKDSNTSSNPCLLRVLEFGGHDVGSGEDHYVLCAQEQLFLEKMLNMI